MTHDTIQVSDDDIKAYENIKIYFLSTSYMIISKYSTGKYSISSKIVSRSRGDHDLFKISTFTPKYSIFCFTLLPTYVFFCFQDIHNDKNTVY